MHPQTKEFLDKIQNFEIKRRFDESEYDIIKRYHKTKLCMCYDYLKLLTNMKTGSDSLKEDYLLVKKLTQKFEQDFLRWKNEENT
jgi:hypothetical protein